MKKILLIGSFSFDKLETGGQPVKSRELYYLLSSKKDLFTVNCLETISWKRNPLKFLFLLIKSIKNNDTIIMLPAHNGLLVFSLFLVFAKKLLKKRIIYDVIGGWLVEAAKQHKRLIKRLKQFDGIWVETNTMKDGLLSLGINCTVIPNFKDIEPLSNDKIRLFFEKPYKICFFSRIMEKKGIRVAIETVKRLNSEGFKYALDIYGQIDSDYENQFLEMMETFPDYIRYNGYVDSKKSVDTLKDYYLLLFPTLFYTEGVPGTLVDSLFAGLPVISSRWLSCKDVVDDDVTGISYDFNQEDGLYRILKELYLNPKKAISMRSNCLVKAQKYTPEYAFSLMNIGN